MTGAPPQTSEIPGFLSKEAWLTGQREALAAALDEAPITESLGILTRTARHQLGSGVRAAFYLANPQGTALHHVVGMSAAYAEAVDGFEVGPDSLACGLATHTGEPVITPDVAEDPLWKSWLWMAEKFGYRACWSFPVHTRTRNFVGTLAIYWPQPRDATPADRELAAMLTQTAGIIIARHFDSEDRKRAEQTLRESQAQLHSELADSKLLQSISAEMAHEGNVEAVCEKILEAAVAVMRSQYGSLQMYLPEAGSKGELRLLSAWGLSPQDAEFWKCVQADSSCTCGQALRTGKRAVAENVETCAFMAGTPDREALLRAGIRAAQSTPLVARNGLLVGMISTHWDKPHVPTERDLRLLDIIARQAADLIERREHEQQLLAREQRYRELVEQMPDGIFVANPEGRYIEVSAVGCAMLGMTREEVLNSVLTDVLVPEEHHRLPAEIARFDDGSIARSEWRVRRKDGSVFDAEIVGRRLPNGNLQGVVRDVTEQRLQERALHERDEFNRSLMDGSADCVKVLDLDGRLQLMNIPGLCIMEIDDFDALRGKEWATLWPDPLRGQVRSVVASARAGQASRFEAACPTAKGNPKVWDVSVSPVRDTVRGQVARLLAVSRDITASKHAEAALRESEERFRMLADNMNQLAWTCDTLGDVTWYNQRWLDYTGLTFEQMKDWGWREVHHPDHVDRVVASVTHSRNSGEPWEDTFPLRGKDGRYRWFLSRAVPFRDASGKIVRWLGTNTDITEHKQAEETQRLLLNELNHRVKNTLAIVQAIAQRTSARTREPAEFAKSFGGRIQSLARVHTLLSDASWQGTDLRELIRDQLMAGSVDESRFTAWGPAVRLEPQMALHLALMLHELATNSSKYGALSGNGWVTVNWATDAALHLRWVERGGPPVARPSRRGFGTTLIEQSAKGHGGEARMLCEAEGITWEITLPLQDADTASGMEPQRPSATAQTLAGAAAKPASSLLAGRRFLVVEDEPLIGLDIVAALEEARATVEGPVATAEQAFEIIESTSFDGALLDASLHGRSVHDVAGALTRRGVPFVFVTGYGRNGVPEAFRHVEILNKPCSREQIINAAASLTMPTSKVVRLRP